MLFRSSFNCRIEPVNNKLKLPSMKNSILKSALTLLAILCAGLAYSQNKEERNVSGFSGISLGIHADLYLSQGSPQKVVIQASEDDLARIETSVKSGHLQIKCDSHNARFRDVKIWITVPDIEALNVSGSGTIMSETPISSNELELKVSGSGNLKIGELKGDEVDASISGSGNIHLAGTADELGVSISGSGSMMAGGLKVDECDARISGSGRCEVDATGELKAAISGSGSVTYFSNPQVDATVSGSGRVKKGDR
jgi:hypothetical protein